MKKNNLSLIISVLVASAVAVSCSKDSIALGDGLICPDYTDITVPCNIAPLNFAYTSHDAGRITTFTFEDCSVKFRGDHIVWKMKEWKKLLDKASGDKISVTDNKGNSWTITISDDKIDEFLTYRLIEPGYEVWHEVQISERDITSFKEKVISDFRNTDNACMNCHIHGQNRGDWSIFYVRGPQGGAMLNTGGMIRKLNLRDSAMVSSTVYGELHPSMRYGVFSTNIIIPAFHSFESLRFEVYDSVSDLVVADFKENRMITQPEFARKDRFETFPVFSAEGDSVYYCVADTVALPEDIASLKYSIVRAGFDASTGLMSTDIDTVWNSRLTGASACHPKCSPDGRWLMYTVADYGTFPIWHQECDLQLMNLTSGEIDTMEEVNDFRSDTYHSWSSNSRWFVFASKRGDGQYGKPYFCHIDSDGRLSKPFVLPQKDPLFYQKFFRSFNIPDLGRSSVGFDAETIGNITKNVNSENFI